MASSQSERNEEVAVQHSLEEKASLEQIMKQAKSDQLLNGSHDKLVINECINTVAAINNNIRTTLVIGVLKSKTKGSLDLMSSQYHTHYMIGRFPDRLKSDGMFEMNGMSSYGVKAVVVYSGKNESGVDCAWLLAFADTEATGRRIYAECGPKCNFNDIKWDDIEKKLDGSGAIAKPSDKQTGTSIYATIEESYKKSVVNAEFFG